LDEKIIHITKNKNKNVTSKHI